MKSTTTSNKRTTAEIIIENPIFKRTKRRWRSIEHTEQKEEPVFNELFDLNSQDIMTKLRLYKNENSQDKINRPQSAIDFLPQLKLEGGLTQRPPKWKHYKDSKSKTIGNEEFNIVNSKREYERIVGSGFKEIVNNEFRLRPETARTTLTTMKWYNQELQ